MLIWIQLILYCLLYILLVKCAVKSSGLNCLYFYPKAYIEEARGESLNAFINRAITETMERDGATTEEAEA